MPLQEIYLVVSPERDVYVWNEGGRAAYPLARGWDRGLQSLLHANRAEVLLDLDTPGGRYTRRLWEKRVRQCGDEVAAAREDLGLDPYPQWVRRLADFLVDPICLRQWSTCTTTLRHSI